MSKKVVNKTNLIIVIVLLFSISLYYSVQGNTIFDRFFSFSPPQKNLIEPEVYSNIQGIISPSLTERISNFQISLIVEDLGDAEVSTQNLFINGQLIEAQ